MSMFLSWARLEGMPRTLHSPLRAAKLRRYTRRYQGHPDYAVPRAYTATQYIAAFTPRRVGFSLPLLDHFHARWCRLRNDPLLSLITQVAVDGSCRVPAFGDGPHHQRL